MALKKYCLYLKFYYERINTISNRKHIIDEIDSDKVDIYIWIYDKYKRNIFEIDENLKCLKTEYNSCIFVTNFNQSEYLTEIENEYLYKFKKSDMIIEYHKEIGESHLKAFMIPKNVEYVFKLDADDMNYQDLKVIHLDSIIHFMDSNLDLQIITRPYWIKVNRGWSFGFTVARKNILDYMNIFENAPNLGEWISNNRLSDLTCCHNLDNLFGQILIKLNIPFERLFFQ